MNVRRIAWSILGMLSLSATARGGSVTVFTDLEAFRAAAGPLVEIDFESLPDGSPTPCCNIRVDLTPEFNYTGQGVTFSAPVPDIFVAHRPGDVDATLEAQHFSGSGGRNWIIADFVLPATAIGTVFPGGTTLSIFDEQANLLGAFTRSSTGLGVFLGVVSDVPFRSAVVDRGASGEVLQSFVFTPVPEPATLLLVGAGAFALVVRKRR